MKVLEVAVSTSAKPATIWNRWIDVETWHEWCTFITRAKLYGSLKTHARGVCIIDDYERPFTVLKVVPDSELVIESEYFSHTITCHATIGQIDGMQQVKYAYFVDGTFATPVSWLLYMRTKDRFDESVENLVEIAEHDQRKIEKDLALAQFKPETQVPRL